MPTSILVESGGTLRAGAAAPVKGPISIWLYGSATDGIPSITCKSDSMCGIPQNIWTSNTNVPMNMQPTQPCVAASNFDPDSPLGGDCFYQYEKMDADDIDGAFFGRKVLALSYGGSIRLRGWKGSRSGAIDANPSDSGVSWVHLAANVAPNATALYLDRPVPTWGSGDHIVLTTTDYQLSHTEELIISSVTSGPGGTVVNLANPVRFPHWGVAYDYSDLPAGAGPRDDPNRPSTQASRHVENRATVALLTRSIMIASEGDTAVMGDRSTEHFPTGYYGGHTLMRSGFASYQVQGVEFYQLGQAERWAATQFTSTWTGACRRPTTSPPFDGTYVADSAIHESNTRFIHRARDAGAAARPQCRLSLHRPWLLSRGCHRNQQPPLFQSRHPVDRCGQFAAQQAPGARHPLEGGRVPARRCFRTTPITIIRRSSGS